jgi:hypothetical protein
MSNPTCAPQSVRGPRGVSKTDTSFPTGLAQASGKGERSVEGIVTGPKDVLTFMFFMLVGVMCFLTTSSNPIIRLVLNIRKIWSSGLLGRKLRVSFKISVRILSGTVRVTNLIINVAAVFFLLLLRNKILMVDLILQMAHPAFTDP